MRIQANRRLGSRARRRYSPSAALGTVPQGGGPVTAATSATVARPGGGTTRSGAGTVDFELAPWVPTTSDPFDAKKAAHLLRRAGFGARPDEIQSIVAIGPHRTVDLLVIPANWGIQQYGSVMLSNGEVLNLHYDTTSQRAQWIHEAVFTHFPLKEKMALFFHDHFSTGENTPVVYPMQIPHVNIFRRHGLGKFRDVLIEVSRDPDMLWWLDNRINGAGGKINENYGREILELYSMGVTAPYTQKDVEEASRCFAGWSLTNYNQFRYNTSYAAAGAGKKTFMGVEIYNPSNQEREGYMLIDEILKRPETAHYMVGKIWAYFVAERPATAGTEQKLYDDIIVELAKRWQGADYDLRALMWVILSCNYFYSARAMRKLVKNPMEFLVGAIRNLDSPFIGRYTTLSAYVEPMGLPLFRYDNPSGLEDGIAWIDSQTVMNRSTYVDDLTQVSTTANFRVTWNPMDTVQKYNLTSAKAIVDHFLRVLVDDDVPSAVRQNLYYFMDYYDASPTNKYDPYDSLANNSQYRVTKIRGLVHLIMMLPEYNVN